MSGFSKMLQDRSEEDIDLTDETEMAQAMVRYQEVMELSALHIETLNEQIEELKDRISSERDRIHDLEALFEPFLKHFLNPPQSVAPSVPEVSGANLTTLNSALIDEATRQAASLIYIMENAEGLSDSQRHSLAFAASYIHKLCDAIDRQSGCRRSFATVDLSEEKAKAISESRMDARHTPLDDIKL